MLAVQCHQPFKPRDIVFAIADILEVNGAPEASERNGLGLGGEFPKPLTAQIRRWVKTCGFTNCGDGATFWRFRTFRRNENVALETARVCVGGLERMGWKEAA